MLSAYLLRNGISRFVGKTQLTQTSVLLAKSNSSSLYLRQLSNQTRGSFTRRAARSRTLKEMAMAPAGEGGI